MREEHRLAQPKVSGIDEADAAGQSASAGPRHLWSHLNAWRALRAVWLEPDPPEFQWRLLRYFAFSRAAVALVGDGAFGISLNELPTCIRMNIPVTIVVFRNGQWGAENGELSIMVGGDAEAFERARPVIRSYASTIKLMGGPGTGQLTKMANQICIAGLIQALAEGLAFARAVGLDPSEVVEVIRSEEHTSELQSH